ncbi:hypothetical protein BOTBODRAFT_29127 [Botryobasidium botryosum FD-172 SS1]|uniref:Transmembrane protein n=1 Tax=Botryobasidium botryosum (strain FD-172 SS1) TaxID=930990 RepID=A0A067MSN2_BOTB1|nr:hypothetical protein BOTBODRAFT_29127 [Botryobasidium botryosum FD-172 SS1]
MASSYWSQPSILTHAIEIGKVVNYVPIGLLLADNLSYASFDWAIIRGHRNYRWPQIPYFLAKIIWYPYVATIVTVLLSPHQVNCQGLMDANEFLMGLITVCCSSLLAARTLCLYSGVRRKAVLILLSVLGLAHLGTWMAGVPDIRAIWTVAAAQPWSTGGCFFAGIETRYFVKYIVTIVFDLTVLILTIIGVARTGGSHIGDILIKHGLIYFIITTSANLVVTVLTILQLSPVMSTIAATPASCLAIMCATRLYVSLHEEARAQNAGAITMGQLTSSSSAPKRIVSFFRSVAGKRSSPATTNNTGSRTTMSKTASSPSQSFNDCSELEKGAPRIAIGGVRVQQDYEVHAEDTPKSPYLSVSPSVAHDPKHPPL